MQEQHTGLLNLEFVQFFDVTFCIIKMQMTFNAVWKILLNIKKKVNDV